MNCKLKNELDKAPAHINFFWLAACKTLENRRKLGCAVKSINRRVVSLPKGPTLSQKPAEAAQPRLFARAAARAVDTGRL